MVVLLALVLPSSAMGAELKALSAPIYKLASRASAKLRVVGDKLLQKANPALSQRFKRKKPPVTSKHRKKWGGPHVKVGLIADVHLKKNPTRAEERALETLAREKLDLILVAGDVGEHALSAEVNTARINSFATRLRAAGGTDVQVVAVLGNHDHYVDVQHETQHSSGKPIVQRALEGAGVTVLRNENISVTLPGGKRVTIVGVDDGHTGQSDVSKAMLGVRDVARALALTHFPPAGKEIAEHGVPFIFAGHTHGGKVHIPVITAAVNWLVGEGPYVKGWYSLLNLKGRKKGAGDRRKSEMYVTSGLGDDAAMGPWRIGKGAQPEVAIIELSPE